MSRAKRVIKPIDLSQIPGCKVFHGPKVRQMPAKILSMGPGLAKAIEQRLPYHALSVEPAPDDGQPLDGLDYVMTMRVDDAHGLDLYTLRAVVLFHWKRSKSPFWPSRVKSIADLDRHLPKMFDQWQEYPGPKGLPGSVDLVTFTPEVDCKHCGGQGVTYHPDPYYATRGLDDLGYSVAVVCPCMRPKALRPWRTWKSE